MCRDLLGADDRPNDDRDSARVGGAVTVWCSCIRFAYGVKFLLAHSGRAWSLLGQQCVLQLCSSCGRECFVADLSTQLTLSTGRYFFLLWSSSSASAASTFVFLRSMLAVHALSFRTCGNSACSYGRTGSGSSGCGVAASAFRVSRSHAHSKMDNGGECVHYVHTSADTSTRACTHLHPSSSASFGR